MTRHKLNRMAKGAERGRQEIWAAGRRSTGRGKASVALLLFVYGRPLDGIEIRQGVREIGEAKSEGGWRRGRELDVL